MPENGLPDTPHVALIAHLEHLPPHDNPDNGRVTFSLNLSTSLVGELQADDELSRYLRPWAWTSQPEVAVYVANGAGGWRLEADVDLKHLGTEAHRDAMRPHLEKQLENASFAWDPTLPPGQEEEDDGQTVELARNVLAYASTLPAPVPQALNLSLAFAIPRPENGREVIAAPIFEANGSRRVPALPETKTLAALSGRKGVWQWLYATESSAPQVRAYLQPVTFGGGNEEENKGEKPCDELETASLLDFETYWIGRADIVGESWNLHLEERVAQGFDLPRILVEAVREIEAKAELQTVLESGDVLRDLRFAFLIALADRAATWSFEGADGFSLLELVIPGDEGSGCLRKVLEAAYKNLTLDEWRTALRRALPELEDGVLLGNPEVTAAERGIEFTNVSAGRYRLEWSRSQKDGYQAAGVEGSPDGEHLRFSAYGQPQGWYRAIRVDDGAVHTERVYLAANLGNEHGEMQRLSARLQDAEVLRSLLLGLWDAAVARIPRDAPETLQPAREFWKKHRNTVEKNLADFELPRRLAVANLNGVWQTILGRGGKAAIRCRFAAELQRYMRQRVGLGDDLSPPWNERTPPRERYISSFPPQLRDAFTMRTKEFAEKYAGTLIPDAGDTSPTRVPHPVVLPVERAVPLDEGDYDVDDPLRRIAGVGVLGREKPPEGAAAEDHPWLALNWARMQVQERPDDAGRADGGGSNREEYKDLDTVLVPHRIPYRNRMRQALVSYDNHPLAAESPAAQLTKLAGLEDTTGGKPIDQLSQKELQDLRKSGVLGPDEWLRFAYVDPGSDLGRARLPGLKFGRTYEFLPFMIGNSGALPKELANGHPAMVDLTAFQQQYANADEAGPLKQAVREETYQRRVRVGAPRRPTRPKATTGSRLSLPAIPEGVSPLARDLQAEGEVDQTPLLLMRPKDGPWLEMGIRSEYQFELQVPSTDLVTWDRWVAGEEGTRDRREQIWAAFYRLAADRLPGQGQGDLAIDDPAVKGLWFEAVERTMEGDEKNISVSGHPLVSPQAPAGEYMEPVQKLPISVACWATGDGEPNLTIAGTSVNLTVPAGRVVELKVYAAVAATEFGNGRRFPEEAAEEAPTKSFKGVSYRLLSPFRLLVETATTDMPSAATLYHALQPRALGSRAVLELERTKDGERIENLEYVKELTVSRQVWRWHGRPIHRFPFSQLQLDAVPQEGQGPEDSAVLWDAEGFATRSDADHAESSALLTPGYGATPEPAILYEEDVSRNPKALYYRFATRAFSRYAPLLRPGQPGRSGVEAQRAGQTRHAGQRWRRLLVPCRFTEEVPKPLVKLVVPLTRPGSGEGLPGLLVVLDEPWFNTGGPAEELDVEVELALRNEPPSAPDSGTISRGPEAGPDPILAGETSGALQSVTFEQIVGPLGHTFDTDAASPHFGAVSFLLEAPAAKDGSGVPYKIPDWFMAKVRFRRRLVGTGTALNKDHMSPLTEAHWVQLLPAFSGFEAGGLPWNAETLRLVRSEDRLYLVRRDNEELAPLAEAPNPVGSNLFQRWVLVTRLIHDAAGHDRETYLGLYRPLPDGSLQPMVSGNMIPEGGDLQARIVEVQYRREQKADIKPPSKGEREQAQAPRPDYYLGERALSFQGTGALRLLILDASLDGESDFYGFSLVPNAEAEADEVPCGVSYRNGKQELKLGSKTEEIALPPDGKEHSLLLEWANRNLTLCLLDKHGVKLGEVEDSLSDPANATWSLRCLSHQGTMTFLPPTLSSEPWDHLFPLGPDGAEPEDAKARIVRVSEPIDTKERDVP